MLYPLFAMVVLTFVVMLITVRTRIAAVRAGEMKASYFQTMSGSEASEAVAKTTRQFNNLFETPTLLYAAGAVYLALGLESSLTVTLAWLFVLARVAHAWIHIGYNKVMHRLAAFAFANGCILAMWINLVLEAS